MDINQMEKDVLRNFSVTGEETSLKELISKLKFIAMVKGGEKIDVKTMTMIKSEMVHVAYRTLWNRETRQNTYSFLESTLEKAVEKIYYYLNQSDAFHREVAKMLIYNVEKAYEGIDALKDTYTEDRKFVTDLEALVETTKTKIEQKNNLK